MSFQPAPSNAPLCVNIVIVNDQTLEVDENFLVMLSSTDQDAIIDPQEATSTVTISDDDGTLAFICDSTFVFTLGLFISLCVQVL